MSLRSSLTDFQIVNFRCLIKHNTFRVSSVMRNGVSIIELNMKHLSQPSHHSFVVIAIQSLAPHSRAHANIACKQRILYG